MEQRTMVKISAEENIFSIWTFSRKKGSSQKFIFWNRDLEMLEKEGCLLTSDIRSFAKMRLYTMSSDEQAIQITFTWLKSDGYNRVSGVEETIRLPYERFKECLEKSREQSGEYQKLLSMEERQEAKVVFQSRRNLNEVARKKILRRKLGRFLDQHFNWYGTKEIRVTDDSCPYSFFFTEDKGNGKGICGGIILHGQENLRESYYGMHT